MSKIKYANTPIKNIGRVVTGKTPETKKVEFYGDGYMFITPLELHNGYNIQSSEKYITELGIQSIKNSSIDGTSVLVGCIGWDMGNVAICHKKCATNQQINSITDFKPQYNPFYTYYWLLTKKDYLFTIASVTRTPILSKSIFEEILIPMPERSAQDNVVAILKPIDEKIENNQKICSELEAMAKTLYYYWFVQFDFTDENGRPYRSSGGAMEWNDQLKREIPKGWHCVSLNEYVAIDNLSIDPFSLGNTTMEHYSIPAYDEGRYPAFESADTIQSGKYRVPKDAILVSKLNPRFKRIWDPYCITENAICSTEFMVYQTKQKVFRPFFFSLVNSDGFYQHMVSKAISSTGSRKRIQPDVSLTYQFAAPDTDAILLSFSKLYQPIMDKMKAVKQENHELAKLRDWLLPMLMNGQARVE